MKKDKIDILDELWLYLGNDLLEKVKSGKATHQDISNAIKFLDKGIIDELKEAKPDTEERNKITSDIANLPFDTQYIEWSHKN